MDFSDNQKEFLSSLFNRMEEKFDDRFAANNALLLKQVDQKFDDRFAANNALLLKQVDQKFAINNAFLLKQVDQKFASNNAQLIKRVDQKLAINNAQLLHEMDIKFYHFKELIMQELKALEARLDQKLINLKQEILGEIYLVLDRGILTQLDDHQLRLRVLETNLAT